MAKKNKKQRKTSFDDQNFDYSDNAAPVTTHNQNIHYPVTLPERLSIDILSVMSDDEISSRLHQLEVDRNTVVNSQFDARPWDIEIAYVKRETQIRRTRWELHNRYMNEQRELERQFAIEEASLPVADFDNFKLVEEYNARRY